ncbi:MAG: hypothetical protein PF549_02665 [Patescibacteria group bacterium]|jgi:hypothetical protein|nr:hypothetical protein [Patescibacteria group bacterium]
MNDYVIKEGITLLLLIIGFVLSLYGIFWSIRDYRNSGKEMIIKMKKVEKIIKTTNEFPMIELLSIKLIPLSQSMDVLLSILCIATLIFITIMFDSFF